MLICFTDKNYTYKYIIYTNIFVKQISMNIRYRYILYIYTMLFWYSCLCVLLAKMTLISIYTIFFIINNQKLFFPKALVLVACFSKYWVSLEENGAYVWSGIDWFYVYQYTDLQTKAESLLTRGPKNMECSPFFLWRGEKASFPRMSPNPDVPIYS